MLLLPTSVFAVSEQQQKLFAMSLEQLLEVVISDTYTLTESTRNRIPASFTRIDRGMIDASGARSLDELLEIFVPALQSLHHPTRVGRRFVTRGIVSNDLVLILVNGRVMNERMYSGAESERLNSLLGDIESIEVIRGPGAAVHGAGALAGVINIKTFDGGSFQGSDVTVRAGVRENFVNTELRYGKRFDDDSKLFIYAGIDKYDGGDGSRSPLVLGSSAEGGSAGQEISSAPYLSPVNQSRDGEFRYKLHAQWNKGDREIWARYVRGGVNMFEFAPGSNAGSYEAMSGHEQFTVALKDSHVIDESLKINGKISYDFYNSVHDRDNDFWRLLAELRGVQDTGQAFSEHQLLTGISLDWSPSVSHQLHLGYEFSYDRHNEDNLGSPRDAANAITQALPIGRWDPWSTDMHSFIGEYQWRASDEWTLFAGARVDVHSKVDDPMVSPRLAVVYTPQPARAYKAILSRSVRRTDEASLQRFDTGDDHETLDYLELIYNEQYNDALSSSLSAYYGKHDLINYSSSTKTSVPIGKTRFYGGELEITHQNDRWLNRASIAYSKLRDLTLDDPNKTNSISAEPQGFGDDFAEVPNWAIKLYSRYRFNERWEAYGSLVSHLGVDGRRDLYGGLRKQEVSDEIDRGAALLSLGVNHKIDKRLDLQLNAHNVLGWLDQDLNNRFFRGTSYMRPDVPSFSFSLRYDFDE